METAIVAMTEMAIMVAAAMAAMAVPAAAEAAPTVAKAAADATVKWQVYLSANPWLSPATKPTTLLYQRQKVPRRHKYWISAISSGKKSND